MGNATTRRVTAQVIDNLEHQNILFKDVQHDRCQFGDADSNKECPFGHQIAGDPAGRDVASKSVRCK